MDEVISGFYRTGNRFGSETYDLRPDLVTLAKALSAAYQPIGAVMLNERVHEVLVEGSRRFGMFGTGFTYTGHPVPAAVALETQKIYEERDIGRHVAAVAPKFQESLRRLSHHPLVGEARGVGLIGAVELVEDKPSRRNFDPARKIGAMAMNCALEHGLIVRALINDTLGICPPLIIEEPQVDDLFDRLGRALDDTLARVQAGG